MHLWFLLIRCSCIFHMPTGIKVLVILISHQDGNTSNESWCWKQCFCMIKTSWERKCWKALRYFSDLEHTRFCYYSIYLTTMKLNKKKNTKYSSSFRDLTREMEGGWNTFAMVVPSTIPVSGAAARKNWSSFFAFPCHETQWPYYGRSDSTKSKCLAQWKFW